MSKSWKCSSRNDADSLIQEALPRLSRTNPDGSRGDTFALDQPAVDQWFVDEIRELCGGAPISHVSFVLFSPTSDLRLQLCLRHSAASASKTFVCVLRGSGVLLTAVDDPRSASLVVDELHCVPFDFGNYIGNVTVSSTPGVVAVFQTSAFEDGELRLNELQEDEKSDSDVTAEDAAFAMEVRARVASRNRLRPAGSSVLRQWNRSLSFH